MFTECNVLYSAKVLEENQGALGMGARGQDRLIESSGFSDNYGTQSSQGSSDISVISRGNKMKTWRSASSQGRQKVLVEEEDREEPGVNDDVKEWTHSVNRRGAAADQGSCSLEKRCPSCRRRS